MVTRLGMSEKLGPVTFGRDHTSQFLEGMSAEERNYSEETAREIDAQVRDILEAQHGRARQILERRRDDLERLATRLLEVETLDRSDLEEILGTPLGPADGKPSPAVPIPT
jgi:cell division protease FtsH